MRNLFLLLSTLLLVSQTSCIGDIEENTFSCDKQGEFLGEYLITPEANEYWVYDANQKRIYVNAAGDEVELTVVSGSYQESINQVIVRNICGNWQTPIQEFDFVRLEQKSVSFRNSTRSINIYASLASSLVNIYEDTEQVIDVFYVSSRAYYNFAVSDRGNSVNIPDYLLKSNLEMISDTTFFGRNFSDLYYEDFYEAPTYFNKSQGVVAFYDFNNNFYVLDRIE